MDTRALDLVSMLRSRAEQYAGKTVYTFLNDGEHDARSVTYDGLDARARAVGVALREQGIQPGDRVLMLFPPGIEFVEAFYGCLYAGAVAVPAFPPDPAAPQRVLRRIDAIARDCTPAAVLSIAGINQGADLIIEHAPALAGVQFLAIPGEDGPSARLWQPPTIGPDSVAFLQYTSGSTGSPKGVVLTHDNLLQNERMIEQCFEQGPDSVLVSWLPLFHDMGLIGVVLHTAYLGAECVLMSPLHMLQRPLRWLEAVSRYRATVTGGPNFAFELCLRKISAEERARLDLSSLQVVFNGAEPVRADTMDRFAETFAECGLRRETLSPCYGLAEATLLVSGSPPATPPRTTVVDAAALEVGKVVEVTWGEGRRLASCGPVAGEQTVIVVDPETRTQVRPDGVGEVWVAGAHVGAGYWKRPEESEATFRAELAHPDGRCYLRTGDLGFFLGGELHIVGRLKDLLIVRGRNLAPQDLERSIEESHPRLRPGCGAVFQVDSGTDEPRIVAVQEFSPAPDADPEEAVRAARAAVARDFEVELDALVLVPPRTIPKTSSGKIQRRAAQQAYQDGALEALSTWESRPDGEDLAGRIESYLAGLVGADAGGGTDGLGVDSLLAAEIRSRLESEYGVSVSFAALLGGRSIAELAKEIADGVAAGAPTPKLTPAETAGDFPLSDGQLALWFQYEREPDSTAYNVPTAFRIRSAVDRDAFHSAFNALLARHPALRTRFGHRGGTPYQEVLAEQSLDIAWVDAGGWSDERLRDALSAEAERPFELTADPLLRIRVHTLGPDDHAVLLVVHHIVADLWSLALLALEFGALYQGLVQGREVTLPPLPVQYADHVRWQSRWLGTRDAAAQLDAWADALTPVPDALELPTDRPRPPVQTERGASCTRKLAPELLASLENLASQHGVTLHTLLLTAFHVLLHRYSGQDDIVVGSPTAGRERSEVDGVFGYFVNPVAIRLDLAGDPSFTELLKQSSATVLDALDRQRIPLVRVVERVRPKRDASRNPLFQAMFVHQKTPRVGAGQADLAAFALGEDGARASLNGLDVESVALDRRTTQFDLLLMAAQARGELVLSLQYNVDLFDAATAQRALGHLETLLAGAISDPGRRLSTLPLLTSAEREQLDGWNHTAHDLDGIGWIHEEFAARAAGDPDAVALVFDDQELTYRELDLRSNQLANYLRGLGVTTGSLVAVAVERSLELVVGLLGVLKAGAAYLPLDPDYPTERLAAVLADAEPEVVLTLDRLRDLLPASSARQVVLDTHHAAIAAADHAAPDISVGGGDPAYVIYTSGSTGRPKGVVNTHDAIRNRLAWMQDRFRLSADDRVLQKTPASFDVSVWEFFWPLMTGARLVLARPGGHRDAGYLVDLIERERVTLLHFVPSMLQLFLQEPDLHRCGSLRAVVCSGEALTPDLARRFFDALGGSGTELHNLYGPTEAAVDVTAWRCDPEDRRNLVPIGAPIANVRIHLLDGNGNEVPIGVPGELHIGGIAVAKGYLNRPELTAERFIEDPFTPGGRLYRTGDLARWLPDGTVDYLGRIDNQVKIHGNRVELGEIEARLAEHPDVRDTVVIMHGDGVAARLVAYVVAAGAEHPDLAALRAFVGRTLPQYMVPAQVVELAELPLTSSGKADRKALPEPGGAVAGARTTEQAVPPRSPEERTLARVFAEVLGLDEVGVRDNFFELGGDSIRGLQVRVRAREAGLDISVPDLFRFQTIEGLAKVARPAEGASTPVQAPFSQISEQDRALLPDGLDDAYPLARLQAGLVFHSELSPDYETYVMGFHLGGRFDRPALDEALARLVARHPLLRTSFDLTSFSEELQLVHHTATVPVTVHDVSAAGDQDVEVERFMAEQKWRKFDWRRPPLLRVDVHLRGAESFQITFSHPLFDGWSMALLITELMTTYGVLARGEQPPPAPPLRLSYADFVALEREAVSSTESREFWTDYLAGASRGELPRWPSRRRSAPAQHRRTTIEIGDDIRDGLIDLAREAGTSLKSVMLAAHLRVVSLVTGRTDITAGVIANGRPEELDGDRVIGVFLNTIPLRMRFAGGSWRDLVRQTLAAERELLPHRRFPMAELVRMIGDGEQLFQTGFNYINFHIYEALSEVDGLDVFGWKSPSDQTYFPLTAYFHLDVSTRKLLGYLDLDDAVFDPAQVDLVHEYYLATLRAMATAPDARYETTCLLPESELRTRAETWNRTEVPWPAEQAAGVHRRVADHAAAHPDAPAVRAAGTTLSYGELDARANQLAHHLAGLGAGPGSTVGVALGRSVDLPVALLGALKTGAAYVPVDPGYPQERLRHVLTDSSALIVVTDSAHAGRLPETDAVLIQLDTLGAELAAQPVTAPDVPFDPEQLAYVIYTSGSTGVPKGVEIQHRALDNLLLAMADVLGWTSRDALLSVTTLSFDIAGLELFLPLTTGARLELATEEEVVDPTRLAARLADSAVTTMQATPATWRMLLDSGWAGDRALRVLSGGEAITAELAETLRGGCRELWNVYGPTETTIWSAAAKVDTVDGAPPIGYPLANTTFHVLDAHGQSVPVGTPGELYIGGLGLARGYRNLPDLTARAFVPDPFADDPRARLYRTGDLVRWRPDGQLEYLSRLDSQVKVRGFRIELGEIETVLERCPTLRRAVAVVREDVPGDAALVAYVVAAPDSEVDQDELRATLAARVPNYMVPGQFVVLEELPLTPNGKVDRRALPTPSGQRPAADGGNAPPRTETEAKLAEIWRSYLRLDRIGIDEKFFEVGGHSLLMVRIHTRVREEIAEVPLTRMFEHPTVRSLAAFIDGGDQLAYDREGAAQRVQSQRATASRRRAKLAGRRKDARA